MMARSVFIMAVLSALLVPLHAASASYVYDHGKTYNGTVVLHDALHAMFPSPRCERLQSLADWLCIAVVVAFFAYFLLIMRPEYILAFLFLRLLAQYVCMLYGVATVLPDSKAGTCKYNASFGDALHNMGTCNLLNMSGHLITIGIALYLWSAYQRHSLWLIHTAIYTFAFGTIAISRNHYTIDCINSTAVLWLLIAYKDPLLSVVSLEV